MFTIQTKCRVSFARSYTLDSRIDARQGILLKIINMGPGKFGIKKKQNVQTYVTKDQNIFMPWTKFQNIINIRPFNKVVWPGKKSKND